MKQKREIGAVVLLLCMTMAFFIGEIHKNKSEQGGAVAAVTMTLASDVLPMMAMIPQQEVLPPADEAEELPENESEPEPSAEVTADGGLTDPEEKTIEPVTVTDSVKAPAVLIYHTHTTESYQPVSEGNFHSVEKEGTVRQVGDAMENRLKELGYVVIHDETIHDNPSYNQSYSRSLETAQSYLKQYPQIALVVDLHRDAAGYAGSVGKTVSVEGKNSASYGYVIGQGNPNVMELTKTVNDLNRIAEALYPGFTGKIIEKAYKFNQYISDHHVLIEVGNNENTIEQAILTGQYLGDVIAAYLKERGI